MIRFRPAALSAIALAAAITAPGCVFQDIQEQLVEINATTQRTSALLARATESLETANLSLAKVQEQLDEVERTNKILVDLEVGLGTDSVDPGKAPEARKSVMNTLTSIDTSLGKLDLHLASLRRTLENIDSTIPFIGFADPAKDEPVEGEGLEGAEPGADGAPSPDAAPATDAPTPASDDAKKKDAPEAPAPTAPPPPAKDPPSAPQ